MTTPQYKRPWYRMRWQLALIVVAAIIGSVYLRYQAEKPLEISIMTGPTGQNKTLKERMIFLVNLERAFHKKGWPASFDLEGDDGKTLKLYWERINRPLARKIVESPEIVPELREMG